MAAHLRHFSVAIVLAGIIAGCDNARDASATSGAPNDGPRMELELTGTIAGEDLAVGQAGAVAADPEGRIYVADVLRTAQEVVVFDSAGSRLGAMGGPGAGPGEFSGLRRSLVWFDDALVAFDGGKVVLFEPTGEVKESWRWQGGQRFGTLLTGSQEVLLGRETILQPDSPRGIMRYVRHLGGGSEEGLPLETPQPNWPWSMECLRTDDSGFIEILSVPFARWAEVPGVTPDGELAFARRDEYRIDLFDLSSGELVRTITRDSPPVRLDDELWERQPEVRRVREFEQQGRLVVPSDRDTQCPFDEHRPDYLPKIRVLLVDEVGNFWVESATEEGFELTLFDPAGTVLGIAEMPPRDPGVLPYVRNYQLYLVIADALGVHSVERYEARGAFR